MKSFKIVLFLLLSSLLGYSQFLSVDDAKDIKPKKVIIALREYPKNADAVEKELIDSSNVMMVYAMKNYWTFNEVAEAMPLTEAKKFVEKNKKTHCYVYEDLGVSKKMSSILNDGSDPYYLGAGREMYSSSQERVGIYNPDLTLQVFFPYYEGAVKKNTAVYAVLQMNKICELFYTEKITSMMGSWKYIQKNGAKLANKTLLIPVEYISPKLTEQDIKAAYPYPIEFCDLQKIEQVILSKDPKYAVLYYIPTPVAGRLMHRLFITNAEDGDIYAVSDGSHVAVGIKMFGYTKFVGGSDDRTFLINKLELKQLAKFVK